MHLTFQGFDNHPRQPHNTCGQAVIASILHFKRLYPFAAPANTSELLDRVLAEYGPHWPMRNMATHPRIIEQALKDANISFARHSRRTHDRSVLRILRVSIDNGCPVIVLLDVHTLGLGSRFTLHWAVVVGYDDDAIYLSTWGKTLRIANADFERASSPWFLPSRYREYMIVVE